MSVCTVRVAHILACSRGETELHVYCLRKLLARMINTSYTQRSGSRYPAETERKTHTRRLSAVATSFEDRKWFPHSFHPTAPSHVCWEITLQCVSVCVVVVVAPFYLITIKLTCWASCVNVGKNSLTYSCQTWRHGKVCTNTVYLHVFVTRDNLPELCNLSLVLCFYDPNTWIHSSNRTFQIVSLSAPAFINASQTQIRSCKWIGWIWIVHL